MKKYLFLLPLLFAVGFPQDCEGEWQFTEEYFNEQLVAYYLNAIDIDTGEQNFELFRYWVTTGEVDFHPFDFAFSIHIYSPQLGFPGFEWFGGLSARITPTVNDLHVRNTDISGDTQVAGAYVEIVEEWSSIDLALDEYSAFSSVIMQSGRLPNGIYQFTNTITDYNGIACSLVQILEVYEPEYLELLAPGGDVYQLDDTEIYTTYPVFSWNADYCADLDGQSKCSLGIRVCEYRPGIHSSLEDAINDMSYLPIDQGLEFYPIDGNARVIQYPTAGAVELMPGKLYAWQLQRSYETTQAHEDVLSDIFVFRILSTASSTHDINAAMDLLRELLGEEKYSQYFGPGNTLDGFSISDESFTLNGKDIPLNQLVSTLQGISSGGMQITNTEVEQ